MKNKLKNIFFLKNSNFRDDLTIKLTGQLAVLRRQRAKLRSDLSKLTGQLTVLRRQRAKLRSDLSLAKTTLREETLIGGRVFFDEITRGASFACSSVKYIREQLTKKDRLGARCFAHALMDDPETKRTGLVCAAIFAYSDGFPNLACSLFGQISPDDAMKHAPVEYIHVRYETDKESALRLLKEKAAKAGPTLLFEMASLAVRLEQFDIALEILRTKPTPEFLLQLGQDSVGFEYLRNALLEWSANREKTPSSVTKETVYFGLIDYRMLDYRRASSNVGDHVQTLALFSNVVRFSDVEFIGENGLGEFANSLKNRVWEEKVVRGVGKRVALRPINRDFSRSNVYTDPTWVVAYGWFMHPNFKTFFDFPFAEHIRPIFISFHVNNRTFLTPKAIDYLRRYQPIGCRDWTTVYLLREYGIKAFFSGCMTTTMGKLYAKPDASANATKITALVDYRTVPGEFANSEVTIFQHADVNVRQQDFVENLMAADALLDSYRAFGHVVTSRLHCYLPCSALGLEVTFKPRSMSDIRFEGLVGLDKTGIASIADGIEDKLETILGLIFSGADEQLVYARWGEICANAVNEADQYCRTYPPLPKPGFNIQEVVSRLQESAWHAPGFAGNITDKCVEVAFAVDQNLQEELPVVLESMLTNTRHKLHFHVMTRGVNKKYWEHLHTIFKEVDFTFYNFDIVDYGEGLKMLTHTTESTMDRLLLPELLSALDKVIYLDVDILVLGDVGELWDIELGDNALAGKSSNFASWKYGYNMVYRAAKNLEHEKAWELRRRMHDSGPLVFNACNAGVLVMNLKRMRNDRFSELYIPLIEHYKMNDQDALNVYARTNRINLGVEWNAVPSQDNVSDAKIIHFAGPVKPWGDRYITMKPEYLRYKNKFLDRIFNRQQKSNYTYLGRHARIIQQVQQGLEAQNLRPKKILSFGCSEGYECLDIAEVFPDAKIFGCDIDAEMLEKAQMKVPEGISIFYSSNTELNKYGPFDLIFVLNVLCRYPKSAEHDDISAIYPFAEFDNQVSIVDQYVNEQGAVAIYNSAYFFEDSSVFDKYQNIPLGVKNNGWIEKCDRTGQRLFDAVFMSVDKEFSRDEFRTFMKITSKEERAIYEAERVVRMTLRPGFETSNSLESVLWVKA